MNSARFELFGFTHWVILGLMLSTALLLIVAARYNSNNRLPDCIAWGLVILLAGTKIISPFFAHREELLSWQNGLPMQLCDWAAIVAIIALLTRNILACELAYFWGLAGTLQAVLTPDVRVFFPHPLFITFFLSHCGIIVTVLYITVGLRLMPRAKSVLRVFAWSQVYLVATLIVNGLLNSNYGYLRAKPINPSLLDHFGPWPWYILVMELAALVSYMLYYLPFFLYQKLRPVNPASHS